MYVAPTSGRFFVCLFVSSSLCLPVAITQELALGHRAVSWMGVGGEAATLGKLRIHQPNDEPKKLLGSGVSRAIWMRSEQRRESLLLSLAALFGQKKLSEEIFAGFVGIYLVILGNTEDIWLGQRGLER